MPETPDSGDVYFYRPTHSEKSNYTPPVAKYGYLKQLIEHESNKKINKDKDTTTSSIIMSEAEEKNLEFALTEIFNYYSRKYQEKYQTFDHNRENLYRLGMRGYIHFAKNMQIPIDKARVVEVWKKAAPDNNPHLFADFKKSLYKLAVGSIKFRLEKAKKQVKELDAAIKWGESGKK